MLYIHLCVTLRRLHYANAVLTEVMRINPAVPMTVPHRVVKDTTLNDYTVPKVRPSKVLVTTFIAVKRHRFKVKINFLLEDKCRTYRVPARLRHLYGYVIPFIFGQFAIRFVRMGVKCFSFDDTI
jgi:hypothetical protein